MTPKILIAVPSFDDPAFETIISLKKLEGETDFVHATKYKKSTYIHTARNCFVYDAVDLGANFLMFIDADMSFAPIAFNNLVKHSLELDADVIGGLYVSRYDETKNIIKEIITDKEGFKVLHDIEKIPTFDKPFEVDGLGTGFMLINMRVFQKLDPPFFYYPNPKDFGLKEVPFPKNELGDDISFCMKVRQAGMKIYCDPTFELGHVGKKVYRHPHYAVKDKFEGNIE
jgi:GT2 family glycosyltransferase